MPMHVDERLIQRCVDNELSSVDRRRLLEQLRSSPDGWKTLACTYMEEQLFAAAVIDPDQQDAARLAGTATPVTQKRPHWLHHPLTSVALSACVAFMLGLLISGNANSDQAVSPMPALAKTNPGAKDSISSPIASRGPLTDSAPVYRVQFESDGDKSNDVPVYHDRSRHLTEYESVQQRVLNSIGGELPRGNSTPQVEFIRLPLKDGRVIVVPVESFQLSPRFQ